MSEIEEELLMKQINKRLIEELWQTIKQQKLRIEELEDEKLTYQYIKKHNLPDE